MKKIIWEGTDDWDTLLLKRAAVSGELVLSDFTKEALNQFKNKEKCYCSSSKRIKCEILKRKR
jgi:hypothetical protein